MEKYEPLKKIEPIKSGDKKLTNLIHESPVWNPIYEREYYAKKVAIAFAEWCDKNEWTKDICYNQTWDEKKKQIYIDMGAKDMWHCYATGNFATSEYLYTEFIKTYKP